MLPMHFLVANLGEERMILGYPWLATFEVHCNWKDSTISQNHLPVIITTQGLQKQNPTKPRIDIQAMSQAFLADCGYEGDELFLCFTRIESIGKTTVTLELAQKARDQTEQTIEEMVPKEYLDY